MDNDGILRVGGRLQGSQLPEAQRHQILIPQKSHLAKLIVDHFHQRTYHGGFQLTWNSIGSQFWVMGGRNLVRLHVRNCVTCRRYRAQAAEQLMGNLPSPRVTPICPFLHTGVDYAGPFQLKNPVFSPGRSPKYYKGYICLFVCLATKAIHLELVSSLTTEDFIAALRRFVSRRGICKHLYSDNGKNFVGAETELKKMFQAQNFQKDIINQTATNGIIFHFNPPHAPHRGGLWESAVKSCKHHIRRVMGSRIPTYEEFLTLLNQIEAILNSRPLYKASDDPNDMTPLTPGHFLIGQPLLAIPEEHLMDIPTNRLRSTLKENQQRLQFFWSRWSREYLNTLQARNKWYVEKDNLAVNDIVLLVEDTPPGPSNSN